MNLFQIRNFLTSCLLLAFASCSLYTSKGYLEQTSTVNIIKNVYFSNPKKDYVYKANFEIYKYNLGGILIIKKIDKNHHRFVFTTEFGKKIFDFELMDDIFKTIYVLNKLNKKIIISTLQKDLQLLVKYSSNVLNEFIKDDEITYQTELNKQFNYYFISNNDKHLIKIISASKKKEKLVINFKKVENKIATEIEILHKNIKLNIHLNYMGD